MASTGFPLLSRLGLLGSTCLLFGLGCGARTGLLIGDGGASSSSSSATSSSHATTSSTSGSSTHASTTSVASTSSTGGCVEGAQQLCGSNVGACKQGTETCHNGVFGACVGAIGPKPEACNGIDENCNGTINDCDPGAGPCSPTLDVVSSTPSSPNCIDFPVMAGSQGTITYQCPGNGGAVTAVLGGISFTGTVTNNTVKLDGFQTISPPQSPDGCTWQNHHHIEGVIQSGVLSYSYAEMVIVDPPGKMCWNPCTETGTVKIIWPGGGG